MQENQTLKIGGLVYSGAKFFAKRKRDARRLFKIAPLFVLELMQSRFPGYSTAELLEDLPLKHKKAPSFRSCNKPRKDFRGAQIDKITNKLKELENGSEEYYFWGQRLSNMLAADQLKADIIVTYRIGGKSKLRHSIFHWSVPEVRVKRFVQLAEDSESEEELQEKMNEENKYGI